MGNLCYPHCTPGTNLATAMKNARRKGYTWLIYVVNDSHYSRSKTDIPNSYVWDVQCEPHDLPSEISTPQELYSFMETNPQKFKVVSTYFNDRTPLYR